MVRGEEGPEVRNDEELGRELGSRGDEVWRWGPAAEEQGWGGRGGRAR